MLLRADYYSEKAQDLHERERSIKAARGKILDCNGKVLADNKTVCTISVIHSQIKEPEKVIDVLTEELGLERDQVKKRVEKNSSIERIKTNVDKQTGDKIREYDLTGVKVDEDYKRNYPYGNLASKVLGFTGSDNQGIVGLEVKYESILKGTDGQILTMTDARGVELSDTGEGRKRAGFREKSNLKPGCKPAGVCTAGGLPGTGTETGRQRLHYSDAARERGDPGDGKCTGIRSE